MKKRKHLCNWT